MINTPKPATETASSDRPLARGHLVGGNTWFWLMLAAALLLVADGRNTIALAAWLAPVCLVRFMRTQTLRYAFAGAYAARLITLVIADRGMIPIPGVFYYVYVIFSAAVALLPYLADRWLVKRLTPGLGTLVFPTATVALQFLLGFSIHGSWGSMAYTQSGDLPLLQLLAITGLGGVTFLVSWFAPVANLLLEQGLAYRPARHTLAVFVAVCAAVIFCGGLRLALFPVPSPVVRVASLSSSENGPAISNSLRDRVIHATATPTELDQFNLAARAGQDSLLERSEREARAGARVIFWSEGAATVLRQNEPELIARGRALASQYKVYLGMTLSSWAPGVSRPLQNKLVLIDPSGQTAWQYLKARPTPGPEMAMASPHDGKLRWLDSPYGRLSAAICYDMDFPRLIAQAGSFHSDLVLSPAHDWKAIDPRHTQMANFRAIEQGFNLVRQSDGGLSAAYDYEGHTLAVADNAFRDVPLVAEVPIKGTRTPYSLLGDWFPLLCWLSLIGLIFVARQSKLRTSQSYRA